MNKLALVFSAALALVSTHTLAAGNVALGQAKAATCIGCHGINGNSMIPNFPKLAGQSEAYLLKQLREFKTSDRIDATMAGMVAPLTDADMQNIAAYYAAQTVTPGTAKKSANIALGEKIYRGGKKATGTTACIACHGPQGKGVPAAGFPALSSQHAAYVAQQLKLFRQDSINAQTGANKPSRANDYEGMMINFTKSLTNTEIDAVSEYIAGLH
ncbi:MAG: c-type cytochrome [Gammaproteobacteria bacterium]|nr:MAG: c-type cytochrome [Gammaproteobacteria bacterium]